MELRLGEARDKEGIGDSSSGGHFLDVGLGAHAKHWILGGRIRSYDCMWVALCQTRSIEEPIWPEKIYLDDSNKMESILDFSKPLDVSLLDQVVGAFFNGDTSVQELLVKFQNHPDSWTRVDAILDKSSNPQTKLIALNILENTIKTKWKVLPPPQKEGIKGFIVNLIIKLSSNPETLKQNSVMITKLNMVLVQIVKNDWPHNWPNFIPELVNSSKTSESLCTNNMKILLLLSEEVFEYSTGQMTTEKMKTMKKSLNREFTQIFQLCDFILENSQDPALLTITLQTLVRFLFWIPVGYIFETKLIETLAVKFFPVALFQNDTLQCLTEIGSLQLKDRPQYSQKFVSLFVAVVSQVDKLLTSDTDIPAEYAKGNPAVTDFVRHLTLFLTGFLKAHLDLLETPDENVRRNLYVALNILLRISQVDDVVIFKICLEYWSTLVVDLYNAQKTQVPRQPLMVGNLHKQNMCQRVLMYAEVLSRLRHVMIAKMAKPEEVLIVEDEYGQIIREPMKDTDSIVLYKNMREALIYLTHLDPIDTQDTMLMKLARQVDGQEWSWHNLNTLCWAIGSISGALSEMQEKTFLVRVIKDLLGLCEMKKGKDHKAVIASNIMYVVGQYPRFLRQHWKFLKTVVNKLFEFMHETHPGVQDMSCDTFLKITTKCRRKFVQVQLQETRPFIEDILENLPETIHDLEQSQIHTFYEAVGQIISSQNDPEKRQFLVFKLMELPNQSWSTIINQANHSTDALWNPATVKQVVLVLKTNDHVASSLGSGYIVQLGRIYLEMLQVYKMYSQYVSQKIQEEGPSATKTSLIRSMRAVKKETLNLIQSFVENCQEGDKEAVYKNFLPALMDPVLDDYKRNVPDARDAEVLSLFAAIVAKLGERMVDHVSRIFESVFQCTLDMITKNFEDFPDHRVSFFNLLHEITKYSFPALLRLNSAQFQLVIDSIVWGIKHLDRNISDLGLSILLELVTKVETTEVANDFFKSYFVSLTNDCLSVLADSFHKAGFRLQSAILAKLFSIIESGAITVPLWKAGQGNFANNQTFVRDFVVNLLSTSFPNVARAQNEQFVMGLFTYHSNLAEFKTHLRDFLIQLKEFSATGEDNKELYMEEQDRLKQQQQEEEKQRVMAVPGLLYTGPSAGMSAPVQDDDEDL